jgi:hypothetical protein
MIQEIFEQWFLTNKCNAAALGMSEILKTISSGFDQVRTHANICFSMLALSQVSACQKLFQYAAWQVEILSWLMCGASGKFVQQTTTDKSYRREKV